MFTLVKTVTIPKRIWSICPYEKETTIYSDAFEKMDLTNG